MNWRDRQNEIRDQRAIAKAALAGWRFKKQEALDPLAVERWDTYDPEGRYHGWNGSLAGAARYALGKMARAEIAEAKRLELK